MQERRKCARSRVLKSAKLVVGTTSLVDCVVHDLTNVGARIEISDTLNLADALDMTFDGGRSIRQCRVVWRTLNVVGVEFSERARQSPT
jgi:hypothetical protein